MSTLDDAIRAVLEAKAAALVAQDGAALAALIDDGFTYVNASGRRFDKPGYIDAYCTSGRVVFLQHRITDLTTRTLGDCALATMTLDDRFRTSEREVTGRYVSLAVFARPGAEWLWAAGQTTPAP